MMKKSGIIGVDVSAHLVGRSVDGGAMRGLMNICEGLPIVENQYADLLNELKKLDLKYTRDVNKDLDTPYDYTIPMESAYRKLESDLTAAKMYPEHLSPELGKKTYGKLLKQFDELLKDLRSAGAEPEPIDEVKRMREFMVRAYDAMFGEYRDYQKLESAPVGHVVTEEEELWKMTKAEYEKKFGVYKKFKKATATSYGGPHKEAVMTALNMGKKVPDEVLADYPDLKESIDEANQKYGHDFEDVPFKDYAYSGSEFVKELKRIKKNRLMNVLVDEAIENKVSYREMVKEIKAAIEFHGKAGREKNSSHMHAGANMAMWNLLGALYASHPEGQAILAAQGKSESVESDIEVPRSVIKQFGTMEATVLEKPHKVEADLGDYSVVSTDPGPEGFGRWYYLMMNKPPHTCIRLNGVEWKKNNRIESMKQASVKFNREDVSEGIKKMPVPAEGDERMRAIKMREKSDLEEFSQVFAAMLQKKGAKVGEIKPKKGGYAIQVMGAGIYTLALRDGNYYVGFHSFDAANAMIDAARKESGKMTKEANYYRDVYLEPWM